MTSVRVETEGLNWRVQTWGDPSLPALVFLHGFTWQGAAWEPIAQALSSRFYCVAPDLPGHGATSLPMPSTIWPFERVAEAVWELIERMGLTHVTMVGYSMGGRIALKCAVTPFQHMERLVLIGASAGLSSASERRKREQDDAELAASLMREGMEPFLERWMTKPMFAGLLSLPQETREALHTMRLAQDAHGLAASLLTTGVGSQPYLMESLADCKCPTLLVVGERDAKFSAIAREMLARLPDGRLDVVPECGHSVPFECPETLCDLLIEFMTEAPRAASLHEKESPMLDVATLPDWQTVREFSDIKYHKAEGIAKITINRPEVRNAFRPQTLFELAAAFNDAHEDPSVGVIILTGEGPLAFCSGGDQRIRGNEGYVGFDGVPRLNVLDLQKQIRSLPKPVVAMVAGYAVGGGHVLHLVCDLTIAADNARFGQTGPKVGSFDGGFGASYLADVVGQKKAREIWFLCRQYDAQEALQMGLVNKVVPLDQLEAETVQWCREILQHSPLALRCLKSAFNAGIDGQVGVQELAGNATLLYYMSEEAQEGRNAYVEKRKPNFSRFPRRP